jgi:hypothetical protein
LRLQAEWRERLMDTQRMQYRVPSEDHRTKHEPH